MEKYTLCALILCAAGPEHSYVIFSTPSPIDAAKSGTESSNPAVRGQYIRTYSLRAGVRIIMHLHDHS